MGKGFRFWILSLQLCQFLYRETVVNMASTIPQKHISACNWIYIPTEVTVGTENNLFIFWKAFNYFLSIRRCHNYISQCFYCCRCVYITDNSVARMLYNEFSEIISVATIGEWTSGRRIWNQHFFIRTNYFASFSHKINATHHNYWRIYFISLLSQSKTVAYIVGNILNFAFLIIVT